jgi:hypothetical protein
MTIGKYLDLFLWTSQHSLMEMLCTRCLLYLKTPSASSRISLPYRKQKPWVRGISDCSQLHLGSKKNC